MKKCFYKKLLKIKYLSIFKQYIELINRWTFFAIIALVSGFTILYVANVVYINKLLKQNQILDKSYSTLKNSNNTLRSRLIELQSPARIIPIAEKQLGMVKTEELATCLKE